MDLCIVSSNRDFIAIKTPFCLACAEKKLDLTILKRMPVSFEQFGEMKNKLDLYGVSIKCEC